MPMKLAKYLGNLGYGSRRDVERMLKYREVTRADGTVLEARRLVLVASGAGKAAALAAAVEGPLSASCPASVLQWHADAVVVLDEAAAGLLVNRGYYDASAAGL